MAHVMMTETGQQIQNEEVATDALGDGDDGLYDAGGVTVGTDLGRVDTATASISDAAYVAVASPDGAGGITVELYNQDGTGEVAADVDISGNTITFTATRQ